MKIIKKLINVLTTLIIVVGGLVLALYAFGITPYVVLSGSMEPTIEVGSLCFVDSDYNYKKVKEKDIIAFRLDNNTLVTHRVNSITDEGIVTKGDANKMVDGVVITKSNYVGKNIFWIPKLGYVVVAFQSTRGKIILATCVLLLFVSGFLFGEDEKKMK